MDCNFPSVCGDCKSKGNEVNKTLPFFESSLKAVQRFYTMAYWHFEDIVPSSLKLE